MSWSCSSRTLPNAASRAGALDHAEEQFGEHARVAGKRDGAGGGVQLAVSNVSSDLF